MGTKLYRRPQVPGLPVAFASIQQEPIIEQRPPTTTDSAEFGTEWVDQSANAVYFLASIDRSGSNIWVNAVGGAGVFTSLTINPGPLTLTGTFNQTGNYNLTGNIVQTGNIGLTGNFTGTGTFQNTGAFNVIAGVNTVNIGADATNHDINIGNSAGTGITTIRGGTGGASFGAGVGGTVTIQALTGGGGILLASTDSNVSMLTVANATAASPTAAVTINARVASATFTGFTTAAAGSQVFTITNNIVTATSQMFVTASNAGANDAQMTITRVNPLAGSFTVTLTNNGAQALNGNVIISFWIFQ